MKNEMTDEELIARLRANAQPSLVVMLLYAAADRIEALVKERDALLPCPFCGEVPEIKERGENIALFVCTSPPCKGSSMFMGFVRDDRAKAIAAWNRRAAPPDIDTFVLENSNE